VTNDHNDNSTFFMPGLQYKGAAFQNYLSYYGLTQPSLPHGVWYAYTESSHDLETSEFANISFDVTDKLNVEAGAVYFHSYSNYVTPSFGFAYAPNTRATSARPRTRRMARPASATRSPITSWYMAIGRRASGRVAAMPDCLPVATAAA